MVGKTRSVNRDLFVRRCVSCGYDGALLKAGEAARCARCGCDLTERPARSYAEMEGFEEGSITIGPDSAKRWSRSAREPQLIQNWLAFLFFMLLGLLLLISLVAAALP